MPQTTEFKGQLKTSVYNKNLNQNHRDHSLGLCYNDNNLVSGSLEDLIHHLVPTADYYPDVCPHYYNYNCELYFFFLTYPNLICLFRGHSSSPFCSALVSLSDLMTSCLECVCSARSSRDSENLGPTRY